MKNIDLCIISTPEKNLTKLLDTVAPYVDNIHVLYNTTKEQKLEKIDKRITSAKLVTPKTNKELFVKIEGKWYPHFAALRNANFSMSSAKWVIWLDSDDVLIGGEKLEALIQKADTIDNLGSIAAEYQYKVAQDGTVHMSHPKERIILRAKYKWERNPKWVVHENIYPTEDGLVDTYTTDIVVKHESPNFAKSSKRNYVMLKWMAEQPELANDPKVWYLLGRDSVVQNKDLARKALTYAIDLNITESDRMVACQILAELDEYAGFYEDAKKWAARMIEARPDNIAGYTFFAKYLMLLGKYSEAMTQTEIALSIGASSLYDPIGQQNNSHFQTLHLIRKECLYRAAEYSQAVEEYEKAYKYMSTEDKKLHMPDIQELAKLAAGQDVISSIEKVAWFKISNGESFEAVSALFPDQSKPNTEEYIRIQRHYNKHTIHKKNSIAIVCTANFENWDPVTIMNTGGGGSETAVVELAERFGKAGYDVTVYGNPTEEKKYGHAKYVNVKRLNLADEFDILISWRNLKIFQNQEIKARKKYLWLQDIMYPQDYPADVYNSVDKILVLSQYHRWTAPHVPDDKFYFTTNGINIKLIEEVEKEIKQERTRNACLICSSADRGLEPLADMWQKVKTEDATCTWYYGWKSFDSMVTNKKAQQWKKKMQKKLKKAGIPEGGRLSKKELYRKMFTSDFLTYPLIGGAETSCIVLMEAQACGLIPITTGITALEETQQYGIKVPLEKYPEALAKALRAKRSKKEGEYRKKMMKWAREQFNWDKVAANWIKDLFK
jgi:glycosyltransferase involved in cell wall biosynthesis